MFDSPIDNQELSNVSQRAPDQFELQTQIGWLDWWSIWQAPLRQYPGLQEAVILEVRIENLIFYFLLNFSTIDILYFYVQPNLL